jgi:hypothetical protein
MATKLLARRRRDLTSSEFKKPFSDFIVRYTFACIELGFSFGHGACFGFVVNLIKNRLHLSHPILRTELCIVAYLGDQRLTGKPARNPLTSVRRHWC